MQVKKNKGSIINAEASTPTFDIEPKIKEKSKKIASLNKSEASVSVDLFSRAAARQVFSALKSLTTVFGMGTGGPSSS